VPGQHQARLPLDQVPSPALAGLGADEGPELVPLGGVADFHLQRAEALSLSPVDQEGVDLGRAFFKVAADGVGVDAQQAGRESAPRCR
jgi:hypothetical protein